MSPPTPTPLPHNTRPTQIINPTLMPNFLDIVYYRRYYCNSILLLTCIQHPQSCRSGCLWREKTVHVEKLFAKAFVYKSARRMSPKSKPGCTKLLLPAQVYLNRESFELQKDITQKANNNITKMSFYCQSMNNAPTLISSCRLVFFSRFMFIKVYKIPLYLNNILTDNKLNLRGSFLHVY